MTEKNCSTRFFIGSRFSNSKLDISEADYSEFLCQKKVLRALWDIEDVFGVFANSFVSLEQLMLNLCTDYLYHENRGRSLEKFFNEASERCNLGLITFLAASRMYEDQVHRRSSELTNLLKRKVDFKNLFSRMYDEFFEYRLMAAMRNVALHSELPIYAVTFKGTRQSKDNNHLEGEMFRVRTTITPVIDVARIKVSDRIPALLRSDLERISYSTIDVKYVTRSFISMLADVHNVIREESKVLLLSALASADRAAALATAAQLECPDGLHLIARGEAELISNFDRVFYSGLEFARENWTSLKAATRSFVSAEVTFDENCYPGANARAWLPK